SQIDVEIQRLDEAIVKILGVKPRFFRAPQGQLSPSTISYIESKHGKIVVSTDSDSGDLQGGTTTTSTSTAPTSTSTTTTSTSTSTSTSTTTSTSSVVPTCASTHTAGKGETCQSIGRDFGLSENAIKNANPFLNCNDIWQWTPICIPPGGSRSTSTTTTSASSAVPTCASTHTAGKGETCQSIGRDFGLSENAIKNANPFLNCNDIWQWTPICIPPGGTTTSATTTTTATSTSSAAPSCVSTYSAGDNETCTSVATKFGLTEKAVYDANPFVGCDAIWKYTPLCIPPGGRGCTKTIKSWPGATCQDIATANRATADNIQF
ncbi:hypothetical protein FRC17_004849, partial [Serendipita sp. 399]